MKFRLNWRYQSINGPSVVFQSEWIAGETAETIIADIQKTGRTGDLSVEDEMGSEWAPKAFLKLRQEVEAEPDNITVYFDGGFDKETKKAGIGTAVYYEKNHQTYRVRENRLLELESNSEAEYAALYYALQILEELGVKRMPVEIKGDAQGVIMQLLGEWPCFEDILNRWLDRIEQQIEKLGLKPAFITIPRKQNKEADQLAGQALNGVTVHSHVKIE
ncbi:reverse transcriptase-like protein [Heyndrickxia acidiproducens]|uniref:reverse transcriptase-like protein n=1 Tax=Heyndrickxia acidiproducens TaxID=1121084 RepID=UPI00035E7238|nr:reverse transcriptase-like protein [Heyndrickxia acidiproducens]